MPSSGAAAGHRGEVVGAVDRRAVVHVVGARDDDRPDLRLGEPLELGGDALTERRGWTLESNRSPAIRKRSTFSREGEVDGRLEGGELALPLGRGLLTEVVVACAEMHVRRVDEPEHRDAGCLLLAVATEEPSRPRPRSRTAGRGDGASEAPP